MAEERDKRIPWLGFFIYLFAAGLIFFASFGNRVPPPKQLAYSEFLTQVLNGKVDTVRVTNSQLVGMLKPSGESGAKRIHLNATLAIDGRILAHAGIAQ
jgi:hypothetical protein